MNHELFFSPECIEFRKSYANFVKQMDSRLFASLIIKKGGLKARIEIFNMMSSQGLAIPNVLDEKIKEHELNHVNFSNLFEYYFEENNIKSQEQLEKLDVSTQYKIFKDWVHDNFFDYYPTKSKPNTFPRIFEFRNYFKEKEDVEIRIQNLTPLDCELMKMSHCGI